MATQTAFRTVKLLVSTYVAISVLTLAAIIWLHDNTAIVNDAVWVRGTIVVASSLLMLWFTASAAKGSRRAFLRLRLVSAIMVVAIATIVAIPGLIPLWMKIEQGVCGVCLIGVVVVLNGQHLRSLFASQ
jgi:hypothetical protein